MKKILIISSIIILFFAFLIIRKSLLKPKEVKSLPKVKTEKLQKTTIKKSITLTGELLPLEKITLKSKIPGRIEKMTLPNKEEEISETSKIKKGDILVFLENEEFKIKLKKAKAANKIAKASLKMVEITLKDLEKNKTRFENLFKKGAITKKQLEGAISAYEKSLINISLQKAKISEAKALKQEILLLLEESFIKAPFSGVVSKKYLSKGDTISQNTPLLEIVKMDEFKILIKIPERFLSKIEKDKTLEIFIDAYPKEKFFSKINKIHPTIDPLTKMATIELKIPNSKNILCPGMFISAKLTTDVKENILAVPKSCLINKKYIFIAKDNKAVLKKVSLGIRNSSLIEITSGITPLDEIIILGQHKLIDGCNIEKIK
jgi:RND family efflux transporter MFP subunit